MIRRLVPIVAIVASVSLVIGFAVTADGNSIQRPTLNNSGIWASSDAAGWFGRFNKAATSMEIAMSPGKQTATSVDVYQDGATVVAKDGSTNKLVSIASQAGVVDTENAITLPADNQVDLRGGTLAVLDVDSGKLWAMATNGSAQFLNLSALDTKSVPMADLGDGPAAMSVGSDGTVVAASASGKAVTIPLKNHQLGPVQYSTLPTTPKTIQVAALGSKMAVLDTTTGELYLPGGKTSQLPDVIPCSQAGSPNSCVAIQQGGADTGSVVVATQSSLLQVAYSGAVSTLASSLSGNPAAPVALLGCEFGAWAGDQGQVASKCGQDPVDIQTMDANNPDHPDTKLIDPVFRVNWNQLILNDRKTGRIYDLALQQSVDNWPAVDPSKRQTTDTPQPPVNPQPSPTPKALDDSFNIRASRTSVLHVLDNDSDPNGNALSIASVDAQPSDGSTVVISPDRQTILYSLPATGQNSQFTYTISTVTGQTATATVTVTVDSPTDNQPPALRTAVTSKEQKYVVASGGSIRIPVANDFRDPDCDPVTVVSASVSSPDKGSASVTSDGLVDFTAPTTATDQTVTVWYVVTDGFDATGAGNFVQVNGSVTVNVLGSEDITGQSPVANPDVISGMVGQPIVVHPLANDIAGVDPANPQMKLSLAADVESKSGLASVTTDRQGGVVTIVASQAGTYILNYTAAFGSAPTDSSSIRVDVAAASDQSDQPIAVPDQAIVRGQSPALVDVLANDSDPQGKMLTVQTATPTDPDMLSVTVVDGRWVRIVPQQPVLAQNPTSVAYQVTNGNGSYTTGSITVTQLPALTVDQPLLVNDFATVRAGDSTLVSVLANDSSQGGSALSLVSGIPGVTTSLGGTLGPGVLPVIDPAVEAGQDPGDIGSAYVDGSYVRYVAPAQVTAVKQVHITYYAQTATSGPVPATITMTIQPAPSDDHPDAPPQPTSVDVRTVTGDTTTIPIQSWGQDPDGDSVQVIGLASAPTKGRVLSFTADSIVYQAYPDLDSCGTDTFQFVVSDQYGLTGVGTVTVAVTPPGPAQPPMAVDDQIMAQPGATVSVDVLANDFIAVGDHVTIASVSTGATVDPNSDQGPVSVVAPGDQQTTTITYTIQGNADQMSQATLTVTGQNGFSNPPVAADIVAKVDDQQMATAAVLDAAKDPDSDVSTLKVDVLNAADATVSAGVVTIPQKSVPQIITYRLTDPQGGQSAALIYVPAISDGLPHTTGSITIDQDATQQYNLSDYVQSMRDQPVRITTDDTLQASPSANLAVAMTSVNTFSLTSSNGYVGPASVSMEVTDGSSLTDPNGRTSVVSIPVQVGPETPVMYCPDTDQLVQVGQNGSPIDLTSLCHVWAPDPTQVDSLMYCAAFVNAPKDVSVAATSDMRGMILSALGTAQPGDTGTLSITIDATLAKPATLNVRVVDASKPKINPVTATTQGGQAVSGAISLTSPLANGRQDTIVAIAQAPGTSANDAKVLGVGSNTWTVTPSAGFHGTLTYTLTVSDVANTTDVARQTSTTLTVTVVNTPEAPTAPIAGSAVQSRAIQLTWTAPSDNGGADIEKYILEDDKGTQWTCPSTSCTAQPIDNSPTTYKFHVMAVNKVGQGAWSPWSTTIQADTVPTTVTGFKASNPRDGSIDLSWDAMTASACNCSIQGLSYTITWPGGSRPGISGTSFTVTGLANNQTTFSIWAVNIQGPSKTAATVQGWPSGQPGTFTVDKPTASNLSTDSPAVTVTWSAAFANGQGPVKYWVSDNGSDIASCQGITATTCKEDSVSLNGGTHTFQVVAKNQPQQYSTTATASWSAEGQPPVMGGISVSPTGVDQQIRVTGTAPVSRGDAGSSYVQIMIGQTVVQTVKAYDKPFDQTVQSPSPNGTSVLVTARDCYDSGADGTKCGGVSPAASVTPFGPLGDISLTVTPTNNVLNVTASANANGASATLTLSNSGAEKDCNKSSSSTSTVTITCSISINWADSRTISATFSSADTNPVRAAVKTSKPASTLQPPGMTISAITVTPSGPNLTATVTGDGHGLGASLTVQGPGSCKSAASTGTGALQAQVTCKVGYSSPGSFTAQIANIDTQSNRPVQNATPASGTTLAPPDMTLGDIQIKATGSQLTASVNGDGNGLNATLTLTGPCGKDTHSGTGTISVSLTCDVGYGKSGAFSAQISNGDSSVSRSPLTTSASGQTAAAPVMTVTTPTSTVVQGSVTVTATGDGNGLSATLTVTITGTACSASKSGSAAITVTLTCDVGTGSQAGSNDGLTVNAVATMANTQPGVSRQSQSQSASVTTWGPASFKVSAGASGCKQFTPCNYYHYSLFNFTPGATVVCTAYGAGPTGGTVTDSFKVGPTGDLEKDATNAQYQPGWNGQQPPNTWTLAGQKSSEWAMCKQSS
ncbi:MAG: Ig-like domain-containing protein [Propionibacteriaceae bacterium]|nr:Ig-like domain-containing protein [Propionibacteriaceae bacterium]